MLTDTKARKLKPSNKPMAVGGVTGLYLRAGTRVGTGKFLLRFVSPTTGKRRDMGLGSYPEIGLADVRTLAVAAREQIARGFDPIAQREQDKTNEDHISRVPVFADAALRVHATLVPGFRNAKHSAQWINTLRSVALPSIGSRRVDQLTTADFADVLRPIWLDKPETAGRIKQRCERVMEWCIAHRYAATNPVSSVDALLPKQPGKRDRVVHHPAVPWRSLPGIMSGLLQRETPSVGRDALLVLILTAARSGEVRGARWEEFDLGGGVWTIPANRMKARQIHRVPLSVPVIEIILRRAEFRNESPWVFSTSGARPLSDMTMTKLLRVSRIPSDTDGRIATAHGFRSSFRDWASENGFARDLAERALAHSIQNATEAAYHRTDQLQQRIEMMRRWAEFALDKRISP